MKHEESLLDYAFREMRTRILNGTYPPGSKLSTQEISDSLGISRTPVVSAVNRLVAQGLAVALPRRGVVVADFTLQQLREITEVRQMCELYAAKFAIKNAPHCPEILDEMEAVAKELCMLPSKENNASDYSRATELEIQFHSLFVRLAGNSQLTKLYVNNWSVGSMFQVFMLSKRPSLEHHMFSFQEHLRLIELIKAKDEDGILAFIPKHLGPVLSSIDWSMRNGATDMRDLISRTHSTQ